VLNKLELTMEFERLTEYFMAGGEGESGSAFTSVPLLEGAVDIILDKVQMEQHLGGMCADLCLKMSRTPIEELGEESGSGKGKQFKKSLLQRCQVHDDAHTRAREKLLPCYNPPPPPWTVVGVKSSGLCLTIPSFSSLSSSFSFFTHQAEFERDQKTLLEELGKLPEAERAEQIGLTRKRWDVDADEGVLKRLL
jgi:hypothetical protein